MYLRILKKDLKRKKTMNLILLVFIIMAAAFIASGANNMVSVMNALDDYFEMAGIPDYWFTTTYEDDILKFREFAKENNYDYIETGFIQVEPKDVSVEGEKLDYSNSLAISKLGDIRIFDKDNNEITYINDGEIYVTAEMFNSVDNDFHEGGKIRIKIGEKEKEFTIKGSTKDALFGSSLIGMTRFLISENDFKEYDTKQVLKLEQVGVYTEDEAYYDNYLDLDLDVFFDVDSSGIRTMYMMDMLIAGIILVVSICLILISMVILHFTINFTMSEEFREIGVMKAIGIKNGDIRALYIVKYFAISILGAVIGLALSIPFGRLLLENVSPNIVIRDNRSIVSLIFNALCTLGTALIVVMFCYFCTRKIKKISPIDAIRNGETGERYTKKGMIRLGKWRFSPVSFMAFNDILSGIKRYTSMLLIFMLGILLIILPVNTINTLQSDNLITLFNMAGCDHVISKELLISPDENNKELILDEMEHIDKMLKGNGIEADIFQEVLFRMNVRNGDKKSSALAFQGVGEVTTDMYEYMEGTPPQRKGEVALSHITADNIGAVIGDDVEINHAGESKTYTVTAINQSMNNLGEGIRFYQEEELDYSYASGVFGIQIIYRDNPDKKTLDERKELLEKEYRDLKVYTAGEYISYMIGDVAGQLESIKSLILAIVLCINALVAVLMVKSFITKEKGEIAILKAMGFSNPSLVKWQSIRISFILLISIILGILFSAPLSELIITPIFRIMGAYSIKYEIIPFEVYVVYPLIVLAFTTLAACMSALTLRKISASDASNIE